MNGYDFTSDNTQGMFKPFREYAQWYVDSCAKYAKHNHTVLGDMIDFYTDQTKSSLHAQNSNEIYEEQVANGKRFMELMGTRTQSYVELTRELQQEAQDKINNVKFDLKPAA